MKEGLKTNLKSFVAGVFLGVGGILPGVSGGIIAVALGLYAPMLNAAGSIFKKPKQSILFLLPIGIGGLVGMIITGQLVGWLLGNFEMPIMYLFTGFVAGGIFSVVRNGNKQRGFKKRYIFSFLIGAAIILGIYFLEHSILGEEKLVFNAWTAMLCGAITIVGVIIPGVSTSFLLMHLGLYDDFLRSFNTFNIPMLLFAGIGVIVCGVSLIFAIRNLFHKQPGYAYYAVLGFLCASIVLVFPGFVSGWIQLFYIVLCAVGLLLSYFLDKYMGDFD